MVLPRTVATPSDMFRKFKALFSMQDQYTYTEARLQAISEELGRNFRAAYTNPAVEWDEWNQALDAYKAVRRLMPTKPDGKRLGHMEAHLSTQ
jgi:hypothetical protein